VPLAPQRAQHAQRDHLKREGGARQRGVQLRLGGGAAGAAALGHDRRGNGTCQRGKGGAGRWEGVQDMATAGSSRGGLLVPPHWGTTAAVVAPVGMLGGDGAQPLVGAEGGRPKQAGVDKEGDRKISGEGETRGGQVGCPGLTSCVQPWQINFSPVCNHQHKIGPLHPTHRHP